MKHPFFFRAGTNDETLVFCTAWTWFLNYITRLMTAGEGRPDNSPTVNGAPATVVTVRDGIWVQYNKHATVVARGNYDNGVKHGTWREYYDTGELMIEEHYHAGVLHGRFATFHRTGQCCGEGTYDRGLRHGHFFIFDEAGRHIKTLTFERDQLVNELAVPQQRALA